MVDFTEQCHPTSLLLLLEAALCLEEVYTHELTGQLALCEPRNVMHCVVSYAQTDILM